MKWRSWIVLVAALSFSGGAFADDELLNLQKDDKQWAMAGKNYSANRYSTLAQVTTANVKQLKEAWSFSLGALRGHEGEILDAWYSTDGRMILTASADKTARLWDSTTGKELRALRGHAGEVLSAQFSSDGKTVLTASRDRTARLWDVASGKELRALRGHEDWVRRAHFSADGKTVVTASADRTARLWDCAECRPVDERQAAEVARVVGRELSEGERRRFGLPAAPTAQK